MSTKAAAVVVLVCPQCGKKYKGDANKPDARYQCPIDQSTLIRLDTEAALAAKQARSQPPDSGQSDPGWNPAAAPGGAGFGSDSPPQRESSPYTEFIFGGGASSDARGEAASPEMLSDSAAGPVPAADHMPAYTPPEPRPESPRAPRLQVAQVKKEPRGGALSGFEARASVVAALERLGGTDATGER